MYICTSLPSELTFSLSNALLNGLDLWLRKSSTFILWINSSLRLCLTNYLYLTKSFFSCIVHWMLLSNIFLKYSLFSIFFITSANLMSLSLSFDDVGYYFWAYSGLFGFSNFGLSFLGAEFSDFALGCLLFSSFSAILGSDFSSYSTATCCGGLDAAVGFLSFSTDSTLSTAGWRGELFARLDDGGCVISFSIGLTLESVADGCFTSSSLSTASPPSFNFKFFLKLGSWRPGLPPEPPLYPAFNAACCLARF